MVGYSGFDGVIGGQKFSFRQGFHRFKPDGSKFEFLRSTNNNSWGLSFSEEGTLFGSTANGNPSVYLPIPNRYYEAYWLVLESIAGIAGNAPMYPITDKVRQVDWHGHHTAAAGHALYTARQLSSGILEQSGLCYGTDGPPGFYLCHSGSKGPDLYIRAMFGICWPVMMNGSHRHGRGWSGWQCVDH